MLTHLCFATTPRLSAADPSLDWRPAWQVLKSNSQSFHWASVLLPKKQARRLAVLYAFCRQLDDWADNDVHFSRHANLPSRFRQIRRDLRCGTSHHPAIATFSCLAQSTALPLEIIDVLLDALAADSNPRQFQTWSELVRYAYGVAGIIGFIICHLLEVRNPTAWPFAIDLGIAMQLTNIARDVAEDAGRERVYLPQCASAVPWSAAAIHKGDERVRQAAYAVTLQLLDLADLYYRSADQGLQYLPTQARLAMTVAARLYEAIGAVIRHHPERYWQHRAHVSRSVKLWHTTNILKSYLSFNNAIPKLESSHNSELHRELAGWPGSNPAANRWAVADDCL